MIFPIDQVWIDDDATDEAMTREILAKLPGAVPTRTGDDTRAARREVDLRADPFLAGKRILHLVRFKGAFVKPCPGTSEYVCCGLQILHIGQGCPMDCRYCALQAYFNRPVIEVFVNRSDLFDELRNRLASAPERVHRLCTGEFTDSLALEPLTGLSQDLVRFFARQSNATLELKTKTDNVDSLTDVDPRGRVIVSFSMNARSVAAREEIRAPSIERRLRAAGRARDAGYRVGFHFDPIIPFPGWEEEYGATVDAIFNAVDPSDIAWISLGVIRFVPRLKETIRERFPDARFVREGFIRGLDGKSRFPVEQRIAIYRTLAERIRCRGLDERVYFCMESPYVWAQALGRRIGSDDDLRAYLDAAVV